MTGVSLARPWLVVDLGGPRRVLSFAPHRPGFVTARRIVWREVRNADLTPKLDAGAWLAGEMAARGWAGEVGMLTSRDLGRWRLARAEAEGVSATCVATVGLGNAEAVGRRRALLPAGFGTINIAVMIESGLSETAQIEALAVAAQARTAAVMDSGLSLACGSRATGTGTDCIAVAAPAGALVHAGTHTALGEAIGGAVRQAVAAGAADWIDENGTVADGHPIDAA